MNEMTNAGGTAITALVVDTNVLIVASAADDGSPFRPEATPVQEAALRQRVLDWLIAFETDPTRWAVLDWHWELMGEYQKKLTEQDYGLLALLRKRDEGQVIEVGLVLDADGHAELHFDLAVAVTDRADRKLPAAALAAMQLGYTSYIVNACDTDWLDCAAALQAHGIAVEQLLPDWVNARWQAKHAKSVRPSV